ncbi:hypothetical protein NPIL_356171 [Nephila pilipes]|uniref:Uncharacterized protein n=1 Tax=Nephila pilipes TaxID=299642 RepID=A0A8X6QUT4_NEPPI|nr:hypothetical protein NPIL_356171 [Nephila pilipes]
MKEPSPRAGLGWCGECERLSKNSNNSKGFTAENTQHVLHIPILNAITILHLNRAAWNSISTIMAASFCRMAFFKAGKEKDFFHGPVISMSDSPLMTPDDKLV